MAILFTFIGCEENQPDQLAYGCVMLSSDGIFDVYFDAVLEQVRYENIEI